MQESGYSRGIDKLGPLPLASQCRDPAFAIWRRQFIVHLIIDCGNAFRLFSNDDKLPKPALCFLFLPRMKDVFKSLSFASLIHELM